MEWHRRLDQEEAEVLQLERILLDYNNVHIQQHQSQQQNEIVAVQERNPNQNKMEKKLRDIDRSLRELSSISGADGSTDAGVGSGEFVRTSGTKLNKLWRRLTSQRIEKFQPNKKYKLCKTDIEQLYEDAKLAVLRDFGENTGQMEVFLGQTSVISTPQPSNISMEIPQLNLNFSSGQSEEEMMRGNYSPSAAEEGFAVPSTSSRDGLSDDSSSKRKETSRNSSSSAMPEFYSSNSIGQKRFEQNEDGSITSNFQSETKTNGLLESFKNISSDLFSTRNANVSNISINYVLSSKTDSDPRALATDLTKNNRFNIPESSKALDTSTKNESVPNKKSSSQTDNDMMEISNAGRNLSSSNKIGTNNNKSTKSFMPLDITENDGITHQLDVDPALPKNSTSTHRKLSNTIESIEDVASSSKGSKSVENLNNQIQKSKTNSLLENSKSYAPGITASNKSNNSQLNSEIETICSNYSSSTRTNDFSNFIESESTKINLSEISALVSISTESNLQSQLGTSGTDNRDRTDRCNTNERTVESVTSLKESFSKCSKNSSENVPITETNQYENVSLMKTPEESLKTNSSSIQSQTLHSASIAKSNSSNDPLPDFETKIKPKPTNSQSESLSLVNTEAERKEISNRSCTSNIDVCKFGPAIQSPKSSEECATVSILKSLLNSTYNSNSIFISNQASNTASDIQAKLRTNGQDLQNWTNNLIEAKEDSIREEQSVSTQASGTQSLTYPDEATLKSIKSIDNSTNSKHSTDPVSSVTIIASEEDIHSNQSQDSKSEDIHQSYSSSFEDSVSSNQLRSSVIMSIKSPPFQVEVESEPLTNAFYESDFTEGEETNIDDISLPKFETTVEEEQPAANTTDFESRLIDLDVTFEKASSPEKTLSPPPDDETKRNQQQNDSALMPDIISEVELRRRHQAMLENELKQFEHAVPYMYVREIPNKPPPPYVPPAHGSPMTTIFPSEERIKDITFRRTKELYYEILNIDSKDEHGKKPPSVLDENITNIYERIILDICKEYLTEYKPILTSADPNNFHNSLAFFNPPDRLQCMQEFIYKEVRKNLAMDKNVPDRSQLYSVYGHREKRDHIGEIIIQEMFEEDNIWSNFYAEEEEVLELIIEEMIGATVRDICTEVLEDEVPRDSITPTPDADQSAEMHCNNST